MENDFQELGSLSLKFPDLQFLRRGTGKAQFIYVVAKTKAAEISLDSPGYFFEAWSDANEESDEAPVISTHVNSLQELESRLRSWMN
ncbi:MAG: hypothetical protein V4672_06255 [Verrucomicrobiota bacterium]